MTRLFCLLLMGTVRKSARDYKGSIDGSMLASLDQLLLPGLWLDLHVGLLSFGVLPRWLTRKEWLIGWFFASQPAVSSSRLLQNIGLVDN